MTSAKGLEGIVATQSSISSIIDDQLTYVGYTIDDLAENSSFEEVVFYCGIYDCQLNQSLINSKLIWHLIWNFQKQLLIICVRMICQRYIQWLPSVPQYRFLAYMMMKPM